MGTFLLRTPYIQATFIRKRKPGSHFSSAWIDLSARSSTTWERSAKLVKNTNVKNQYLDYIRESHDPCLQLKTVEDELKGTIGKALGKSGEKILRAIQSMKEQRIIFDQLTLHLYNRQESSTSNRSCQQNRKLVDDIEKVVLAHNNFRNQAIQARWELIVHRQAIGFTVNNQSFVLEKFPISDPLFVPDLRENSNDKNDTKDSCDVSSNAKTFNDQYEWWQRVGRWR